MSSPIRPAQPADVPVILRLIRALADYEKLTSEVTANETRLHASLFPDDPAAAGPSAYCVIVEVDGAPAGFALYFFNYSTFLARPGLYLEDLFVQPEFRGRGLGKALLLHLARLANQRKRFALFDGERQCVNCANQPAVSVEFCREIFYLKHLYSQALL